MFSENHHFVFGILISLCILAGISTYNSEEEARARIHNTNPRPFTETIVQSLQSTQAQVQPQAVSQPASARPQNVSTTTMINQTLSQVSRDLNRRVDVNRDRLINCIDAAVLFYQYFPNKEIVRIYVNRNPATDMHHLFNLVLIDGTWRAIEPHACLLARV